MGFNVLLAKFLRSLYQGSGLRVYVADTIPHGSSLGFKVESVGFCHSCYSVGLLAEV